LSVLWPTGQVNESSARPHCYFRGTAKLLFVKEFANEDEAFRALPYALRGMSARRSHRHPEEAFHAAAYATLEVWFESVAQLVEHRPFKALVLGSSPSALTIKSIT
jgi:hypothetical protein